MQCMSIIKDYLDEERNSMSKIDASTVICLRYNDGILEVLLGQNECKNFLKSTNDYNVISRYPGEWKFAGGVVESNETLIDAAKRELIEEFIGINSNECITLHHFNRKETLPIKENTYIMHNYIAFEDENSNWITSNLVSIVNNNLELKRQLYESSIEDKTFMNMSFEDKCKIAPEVHSIQWFNIEQAIEIMKGAENNNSITYVNKFQQLEFLKYGIKNRDPMYISRITLEEIFKLKTKENIMNFLNQI